MNFVPKIQKSNLKNITCFDDITAFSDRTMPVVTMFSGGLDSSYLLMKLYQLGFSNIHAVAVNLGEDINAEDVANIAAKFGAKFTYIDGRTTFIEKGVKSAIMAHAKYLGGYPLSSSLSRPVIAEHVVQFAKSINASLLLHTANLSQNSLPRLNNCIRLNGFTGNFGSPYVQSVMTREQKASELAEFGLSMMTKRKLSGDENLWCREFESGPLDDPENFTIPETAFTWTKKRNKTKETSLKLGFVDGVLTTINDDECALIKAVEFLNHEVGQYGHGRYVGLEHLASGEKVLEVREAPAAMIIMDGLRHLETATLSTQTITVKQNLEQLWVQEAVSGRWGSTLHTMCDTAIPSSLKGVTGTVSYCVDEQRFMPHSIIAQNPKYIRDRDAWEIAQAWSSQLNPNYQIA